MRNLYFILFFIAFINILKAETLIEDRLYDSNKNLDLISVNLTDFMKALTENNSYEFETLVVINRDIDYMVELNSHLLDLFYLTSYISHPKNKELVKKYIEISKKKYLSSCELRLKFFNQNLMLIKTPSIISEIQRARDIVNQDCSYVRNLK